MTAMMVLRCNFCGKDAPLDLSGIPSDLLMAELSRRAPVDELMIDKASGDKRICDWIRENIPLNQPFHPSNIPLTVVASRFIGGYAYQKMGLWMIHQAKSEDSGIKYMGKVNKRTLFIRR